MIYEKMKEVDFKKVIDCYTFVCILQSQIILEKGA